MLEENIEQRRGAMAIKNEDPDGGPFRLEPQPRSSSRPAVRAYRTRREIVGSSRLDKRVAADGTATVTASETEVWVESVEKGKASVVKRPTQFTYLRRCPPAGRRRSTARPSLTMEKQEYWGDDTSYLFDPVTERQKVENMDLARWYPTLVGLEDGRRAVRVRAGRVRAHHRRPQRDLRPATRRWTSHPELRRTSRPTRRCS